MGIFNEIKFAEKICENKDKTLIYGNNFRAYTKWKKSLNLIKDSILVLALNTSFSLWNIFFNNYTYIIKCSFLYFNFVIKIKAYIFFKLNKNIHIIFGIEDLGFKIK